MLLLCRRVCHLQEAPTKPGPRDELFRYCSPPAHDFIVPRPQQEWPIIRLFFRLNRPPDGVYHPGVLPVGAESFSLVPRWSLSSERSSGRS